VYRSRRVSQLVIYITFALTMPKATNATKTKTSQRRMTDNSLRSILFQLRRLAGRPDLDTPNCSRGHRMKKPSMYIGGATSRTENGARKTIPAIEDTSDSRFPNLGRLFSHVCLLYLWYISLITNPVCASRVYEGGMEGEIHVDGRASALCSSIRGLWDTGCPTPAQLWFAESKRNAIVKSRSTAYHVTSHSA
jgi:hypothetical protein